MAPYSSHHSPSLRKTEGGRQPRPKFRFSFGRILGDPFALATISISILAWLIAFASSIVANVQRIDFPNFIWWTLVYSFFCIFGIFITTAADAVFNYHVAIVGYLAADLVFTSSAVTFTIYSANGPSEAAAAGFILLSMVEIVWIFYFGSQQHSTPHAWVDSFALHRSTISDRSSKQVSIRYGTSSHNHTQPTMQNNATYLNGWEASSPSQPYDTMNGLESQARFNANTNSQIPNINVSQDHDGLAGQRESTVSQSTKYKHTAKAIYSYEANPNDPNEISFSKHEILAISDVTGRWWEAMKPTTGETGIAPSNYLLLLETRP